MLSRIYDAYGQSSAPARARTSYTGELTESGSGWYLLGTRPYNPTLRRFLAPDLVSPFGEGGINRYAYCGGDPVTRIDPSGDSWMDWALTAITIGASAVATVITAGAAAATFMPAVMAASTALSAGSGAAAAASSSMAVALATPGIAVATSVATANVVSLVSQVGSVAASTMGSRTATEVFGMLDFAVSLGMSVAVTGMSLKPNPGAAGAPRRASAATPTASPRTNSRPAGNNAIAAGGSRLSTRDTEVVMNSANLSRADLAGLAGDVRKDGATTLAVYTGSPPSRAGTPMSPADDRTRRAPRTERATEAVRLGRSAGLAVTVTDVTRTSSDKLRRELSWKDAYVVPLVSTLDPPAVTGLGIEVTPSRHVSVRAGI
ncbi:RHS repeat-associated core domain-containing protein [Luteibacter sp. Lutesp34]|uniref:RHS repeat-associated core domain-containing protein n=1 Tax=Luteibacter sp. Lutesp34 TaxID=3243030 RepID=UPI0039B41016